MNKDKLIQFDVLRGLAALVVVVCHIHGMFRVPNAENGFFGLVKWVVDPVHTFFFGEFAVYLFFVLSGFVLSIGYFQTFDKGKIVRQLIKRIPRLYFPVLLTSLVYWILICLGLVYTKPLIEITHSTWLPTVWLESYSLLEFFKKCSYDLFILADAAFYDNINPSLWTMPIEFKYSYLLFVSLFFIRNIFALIVYDILLVISLFIDNNHFYPLAFGLGLNISFLYARYKISLNDFACVACLAFALVLATNLFGHFWGNHLFFSIAAAAIVAIFTFSQRWASLIQSPWLIFLGKISFSLYLIHFAVLITMSSRLFLFLKESCGMGYQLCYALTFFISLCVSILAAVLTYYLIEKPCKHIADNCVSIISHLPSTISIVKGKKPIKYD